MHNTAKTPKRPGNGAFLLYNYFYSYPAVKDAFGKALENWDKPDAEMLKFRNFGKKSLEEIATKLKKYDLELGMDVEGIYSKIREARSRGVVPSVKFDKSAETVAVQASEKEEKPGTTTPSLWCMSISVSI